jgi:hypothetical protein
MTYKSYKNNNKKNYITLIIMISTKNKNIIITHTNDFC